MNSPAAASPGAFSVIWDTIVAPKAAFAALETRPRWLIAFAVISLFGIAGALLQIPVGVHVGNATIDARAAHDPAMQSMSPAQIESMKATTATVQRFVWIAYPVISLIAIALAALLMWAGSAIGRGHGNFPTYFALAAHIGIVTLAIYYLLVGILCALHSPGAFATQSDIVRLVPSLAWLAPNAGPKLTVALEGFNPFSIWSFCLLALALRVVGRIGAPLAYVTAAVIGFGNLIFAVPFAQ